MKKAYIITILIMTIFVILYIGHSVTASKNSFTESTETFTYHVEIDDNQNVTVEVEPLFYSSQQWRKYMERNTERSWQLLKDKASHDKWIPVQIVFSHPVPLEDILSWLQQTEFRLEKYVVAGHRKNDIAAGYGPLSGYPPALQIPGEQQVIHYDKGVLVLEGTTQVNDKGLGFWLRNDEVFLVDTTAVELMDRLQNDARVRPFIQEEEKISFVIHWPLSRLSWDWTTP
ncbi:MAG: hypothetical protein GXP42_17375 [Chloroflexi bacterium]|nr:hypothetical protein [Chloroflexota bacterium]